MKILSQQAIITMAISLSMCSCSCNKKSESTDATQAPPDVICLTTIDSAAVNVAKIAEGRGVFDPYDIAQADSALKAAQDQLVLTFDSIHPSSGLDLRTKIDSVLSETEHYISDNSETNTTLEMVAESGYRFKLLTFRDANKNAKFAERHPEVAQQISAERKAWNDLRNDASKIGTAAIVLNNWGGSIIPVLAEGFENMLIEARLDIIDEMEKVVKTGTSSETTALSTAIATMQKQAEEIANETTTEQDDQENAERFKATRKDLDSSIKPYADSVEKWAAEVVKLLSALGVKNPENAAAYVISGRVDMKVALPEEY